MNLNLINDKKLIIILQWNKIQDILNFNEYEDIICYNHDNKLDE